MKTYKEFLNEKISKEYKDIYEVICDDQDGKLKALIEYIGKNGNGGHSFSIVVDPDMPGEGRKVFDWDGDGNDRIYEVNIIQKKKKL